MTDNITQPGGAPALDYEVAKDVFHEKLANDLYGRGRMESAFYHTAQWIFMQGCAGRDDMAARLAAIEGKHADLVAICRELLDKDLIEYNAPYQLIDRMHDAVAGSNHA